MTILIRICRAEGWALTGPFLLVVLCLCVVVGPAIADESGLISPQDAWQQSRDGELVLIDIRTPGEWEETGVPPGAALVSLYSDWGVPNLGFITEILDATGGDLTQPVALICAAGVRTAFAVDLLRERGFARVLDIGEGMLGSGDGPGWIARGLPVETCHDCG